MHRCHPNPGQTTAASGIYHTTTTLRYHRYHHWHPPFAIHLPHHHHLPVPKHTSWATPPPCPMPRSRTWRVNMSSPSRSCTIYEHYYSTCNRSIPSWIGPLVDKRYADTGLIPNRKGAPNHFNRKSRHFLALVCFLVFGSAPPYIAPTLSSWPVPSCGQVSWCSSR